MITQIYSAIVNYGFVAAGTVLFAVMMWNNAKIARSGSASKMAKSVLMPSILTVLSVVMGFWAYNYVVPMFNAAVTSEPVTAAVQAGGVATQTLDNLFSAQPMPQVPNVPSFQAPQVDIPQVSLPSVDRRVDGGFVTVPENEEVTVNALVVPTAQPTTAVVSANSHTVRSGESMYSIAQHYYGNDNLYTQLCAANGLSGLGCRNLRVGMSITLPSGLESQVVNRGAVTRNTNVAAEVVRQRPTAVPTKVVGVHTPLMETDPTKMIDHNEVSSLAELNAALGEQARAEAAISGDTASLNGNSEMLMFGLND